MQENPVRGIRKLKGNLFISLLLFCRLNFRPFLFFLDFLGRREDFFFCTVFSVVVTIILAFLAFIRGGPGEGSGGPW